MQYVITEGRLSTGEDILNPGAVVSLTEAEAQGYIERGLGLEPVKPKAPPAPEPAKRTRAKAKPEAEPEPEAEG